MEIETILKFINDETPSHAKELWAAIDLLSNTIENIRRVIDNSIGKLSSNREFEKASQYMNMSQNMAELLDSINSYTKKYALQQSDEEVVEDQEDDDTDIELAGNGKINYENYRVDEEVAYNIYTDFTHKKPAAFSLNGKKYSARKWKYVFIQTCEILVQLDSAKFESFVTDGTMQGRTRAYFSKKREDIRKPSKIKGTNVFIETNINANSIRNIIVNMLEKYNIPKNQYQIYLSKDLTPLHKNDELKTNKTESANDADEDYHILYLK